MRVYHFSEQPYPDAWLPGQDLRVTLANKHCDPQVAADLYHRYQDEWMLADELGFDIMVNEHHATSTCLSSVAAVTLSILARITKKARLLALGYPLANRTDPLRAAEELAMIDVISRGRLDMGFVKGVPYEVAAADSHPTGMMDRLWEAHDFILKAMTHQDGPFAWRSDNYEYRAVNIWPRPWQQPHPPVWITATSLPSAAPIAQRGHVLATFLGGYKTRELFDAYRTAYRETWQRDAAPDRLAYLALMAVADTEEEALIRAEKVAGYLRTIARVPEPYRNPPGYGSVADNVRALRAGGQRPGMVLPSGRTIQPITAPCTDLIEAGIMFAGTPDQVHDQIVRFNAAMGGIGNLIVMGQGGPLSHEETVDSLTLFGTKVLPRLKTLDATIATAVA